MKKKLEADLMSIAHRVLQMKNKSDINQLCIETQKLYEKLSVLRFVEEHFGGAKPTIGQAEIVEKMKQFFEENHLSETKPIKVQDEIVVEEITQQEIVDEEIIVGKIENASYEEIEEEEIEEEEIEEVREDAAEIDFQEEEINIEEPVAIEESNVLGFMPAFELDIENEIEEPKKAEAIQISFEDFLGGDYSDTLFVKADQIEETQTPISFEIPASDDFQEEETISEKMETKATSLNEKLSKGINIDLNDRIAFVKHLFGNSDEDYNRVLNQIITYDNFEEAQNFIDDMVKPDYNSWKGKDDYSQRFIEIIEKKFD
ncbi:hypothetical protein [Flavobacterium sp.]|jgi:hypothetical protein|uniref:hypothetical protein n=1 Tax=Flavobacterium sp. TaxID=239 RepID=UPI0037BF4342